MTKNDVHFSSQRLDWQTPKAVFQTLDAEFKFNFDPAVPNFKELSFDGLVDDWGTCSFVNPPYGRQIGKWIAKGFSEYQKARPGRSYLSMNLREQIAYGSRKLDGTLPTPEAYQRGTRTDEGFKKHARGLPDIVRGAEIGTPTGLKLQPDFVEWMMGFPIGWTDLNH